jgi:hypothetical protein
MHPYLKKFASKFSHSMRYEAEPKTRAVVGQVHNRRRQGAQITRQIRVVCADCNGGWMGSLETKVRPILSPMMTGDPRTLSVEEQTTLAQWITLKTLIAEHAVDGLQTTKQEDVRAFYEHRTIPADFRIFIAPHTSDKWRLTAFRHAVDLHLPEPEPPHVTRRNTQLVIFGVGILLVIVVASEVVSPDRLLIPGDSGLRRVWPIGLDWLQRPPLDGDEIDFISGILDRLMQQPNVKKRPPKGPDKEKK